MSTTRKLVIDQIYWTFPISLILICYLWFYCFVINILSVSRGPADVSDCKMSVLMLRTGKNKNNLSWRNTSRLSKKQHAFSLLLPKNLRSGEMLFVKYKSRLLFSTKTRNWSYHDVSRAVSRFTLVHKLSSLPRGKMSWRSHNRTRFGFNRLKNLSW